MHSLPVQLSITMNVTLPARTISSGVKARRCRMELGEHAVANAVHAVTNAAPAESVVPTDPSERQATAARIDQTAYRLACLK